MSIKNSFKSVSVEQLTDDGIGILILLLGRTMKEWNGSNSEASFLSIQIKRVNKNYNKIWYKTYSF